MATPSASGSAAAFIRSTTSELIARPGILDMRSACSGDFKTSTPATIGTSRAPPRRTSTSHWLNVARSKTGCVWRKSAPAAILSNVFLRSASIGFVNGEAVAPTSIFGGCLISSPERKRAWSRMPTAIFTRPTPSRSFTFTASG